MTISMNATEVKARILALLDDVADGEEVEITKHGRVVERLVPANGPHALRSRATGIARSAATDEELFSTGETWDAGSRCGELGGTDAPSQPLTAS